MAKIADLLGAYHLQELENLDSYMFEVLISTMERTDEFINVVAKYKIKIVTPYVIYVLLLKSSDVIQAAKALGDDHINRLNGNMIGKLLIAKQPLTQKCGLN